MFFLFFWTLFFAAGRLIVAREVIIDDANGQISYTSLVDGLNWRPNHICQNCHGPLSVDALTREVVAATQGGSWHTTRGGALQSNASLSFEGTRIAASFVAFKRDGQDVDPARVKECRVKFYIDNRLRQDTRLPWSDISAESRQAAPIFIPRLVLFDQPVEPGAHVFTIQHVCESTERDLVLALDSITYWTSDAESTAGPVAPSAASRKSNNAAIIAGSVVGGLAFIAILACALFWWMRRRRHWQHQQQLAAAVTNSSFGEPARANPWSQLSDIDELTEISNSQTSTPEITEVRPRPPSTAFSVKTLSTLSIFSRPGQTSTGCHPHKLKVGDSHCENPYRPYQPFVTPMVYHQGHLQLTIVVASQPRDEQSIYVSVDSHSFNSFFAFRIITPNMGSSKPSRILIAKASL